VAEAFGDEAPALVADTQADGEDVAAGVDAANAAARLGVREK
jgi:hypothetical protein